MNNPLFAIKMRLDGLKKELHDRVEAGQRVEIIAGQLGRIERAIKSLLGFFRQRSEIAGSVGVTEVIRTVVDLFYGSFSSSGMQLTTVLPDDLPAVSVSVDELQEVLINLLENAREALGEGGRVCVEARGREGRIEIFVEDNGPGLAEDIERLFQPFFTSKSTGTGLGLALSRRICQSYGGTLSGENRQEGGARFTITLPLRGEK